MSPPLQQNGKVESSGTSSIDWRLGSYADVVKTQKPSEPRSPNPPTSPVEAPGFSIKRDHTSPPFTPPPSKSTRNDPKEAESAASALRYSPSKETSYLFEAPSGSTTDQTDSSPALYNQTPRNYTPSFKSPLTPAQREISLLEVKLNIHFIKQKTDSTICMNLQVCTNGDHSISRNPFKPHKDRMHLQLYVRPVEFGFVRKLIGSNLAFLYLKSKCTSLDLVGPLSLLPQIPQITSILAPPENFGRNEPSKIEDFFIKFFSLERPLTLNECASDFDSYLAHYRNCQRSLFEPDSRRSTIFPTSRYVARHFSASGLL